MADNVLFIFKNYIKCIIQTEANGYDTFVYPQIDEGKRAAARNNFGTGMDETILLIRDTGFWNNCTQGLVMTSDGIYCIPDNENSGSRFVFGWHNVKEVKYQELCLYFYDYDGNNCPIHITYFVKSDSESTQSNIGRMLAPALTKLAQAVAPMEDPLEVADAKLHKYVDDNQIQEAIDFCNDCIINKVGDSPEYFCYRLSILYAIYLKDWSASLEVSCRGLQLCKNNIYIQTLLEYCRYSALHVFGNDIQSRKACLNVLVNATNQTSPDGKTLLKDEAFEDFKSLEQKYVKTFLNLPYNERKVLMPVKQYTDLGQDHLSLLDVKNMPNIAFPIGHPIANELYVGHPLVPSKYLPFESYQLELVEDKVREFCQLAQCLGATEIAIECLNSSVSDNTTSGKQNVKGNVDTWYDVSGGHSKEYKYHMIEELSKSISLHQTFQPKVKPYVPEGLVWYENEPSWQRLVSQRINGGLSSHEERIETKKSQMLEGRELTELKAEVKSLIVDMGMDFDKTEELKFTQQVNAVLSIKVSFAPIQQLGESQQQLINQSSSNAFKLSSQEQEYLEEVKECLVDGEIGSRERRLLEKLREKLGISSERAATLENSLMPSLSDDEKEYLEEYKSIILDGEITQRERRLLDKLRNMLGISERRAIEIENIIK